MHVSRLRATALVLTLGGAVAGLNPAGATAAPQQAAVPAAAVSLSPYASLADGSIAYVDAANLPGLDVASAEVAQSAAAAANRSTLVRSDRLGVPLTAATDATGYGHGAGVNVGLLQSQTVPDQVRLTQVDATPGSPAATGRAATVALPSLVSADVLPAAATAAPVTTATTCPTTGTVLASGTARAANAKALSTGPVTVLGLGATSSDTSTSRLVAAPSGQGVESRTVSTVAPVTLLAGTPLALTLDVLTPIALTTVAGGAAGTAHVTYGAVQTVGGVVTPVGASTPVLSITAGGVTQTLTSQQVFGTGGIVLPLGVADVTIGAPAHALAGLEGSAVTTAADGTTASAAADLIRLTVPGSLATPATNPVGGPLGAVLNPVLNPVAGAANPLLTALQGTLASAGLDVADVRVGHLESASTVPAGGVQCRAATAPTTPTTPTAPTSNPLSESRKDVSATDVVAGATFTYDVRVPNRGSSAVTGLTVTDTPAAGLTFVSSTPAPSSVTGGRPTYDLGTLAAGGFDTVTLTFRAPADAATGTVYRNSAVVAGTYAGTPVSTTVAASGPTVVPAPSGSTCRVAATLTPSNTQVAPGERYAYLIDVQDVGGATCTAVTVTDPVPTGTTFAGCQGTCTRDGDQVTWQIGTLVPGQATVVGLLVDTTASGGSVTDTATVTAAGADPVHLTSSQPVVSGSSVARDGDPVGAFATLAAGADAGAALAFTGLPVALPLLALALLGAGGAGLALRRRRAV